jgi:ubiquitin-like 1-activating enzyme E1 A
MYSTADVLALWEFERRHNDLPTGKDGQTAELGEIAEELRVALGVNEKALPQVDSEMIQSVAAAGQYRSGS